MKSYLPVLLALSFLSACSTSMDPIEQEPPQINAQYQFTSIGYAPIDIQSGESFDMKILNAIKASKF